MRHGGSTIDKHIIESVTVLSDPKILGKVAASHLLSWEPIGKVWRNGKLREVEEVVFNRSLRLGEQREVEAAQNTENQDYAIQSLLDNAGPAQLKLRELKKQLEDLQQLTTLKIPLLSQDMLVSLLREAAQEAGLNQSRIDNKLRQIMVARKISLDEIISSEERSKIHAASPREISNGTSKWKLDYHQGIPVVSRFSYEQIAEINNELYLSDGRQVLFWHGRRRMTLSEVIEDMTILI